MKLLDQVRQTLRVKHMSIRTEKAYYIRFHDIRHPHDLTGQEINALTAAPKLVFPCAAAACDLSSYEHQAHAYSCASACRFNASAGGLVTVTKRGFFRPGTSRPAVTVTKRSFFGPGFTAGCHRTQWTPS